MRTILNRKRVLSVLSAILLSVTALAMGPGSRAAAADTVPFSITIRHASCIAPCDAEGLEALLESTPDFYVKVWINGVKQPVGSDADEPSSPRIDDDDSIDPFWTIGTQIPADVVNVPVSIQLWDHDGSSGDDLADISPRADDNTLDFRVDRTTGKWVDHTGREDMVNWPQNCSSGNGGDNDEPAARLCFDIGGDADGDGLLDSWESSGYDDNGDGIVDVDLPAMGARPDHKDLFLELDYVCAPSNCAGGVGATPTRAGIEAMRAAFAAAPISAGSKAGTREAAGDGDNEDTFGVSAPPNPDRRPGITLHVDTGRLVDVNAREGQGSATCADGVDNGGDRTRDDADPDCRYLDGSVEDPQPGDCQNGMDDDLDLLSDADDPDCLVGDPEFAYGSRGGGTSLANPAGCGLDAGFYLTKNGPGGLNPNRRFVFRYGFSDNLPGTCNPTGGMGEIGGNDFVEFNHDGGTIMHEFGHTLNLHHGGGEEQNCKPNYVSVMNYNFQSGIPRNGGSRILDYSPPRGFLDGSSRGQAPLGQLDEEELDENAILDVTDRGNMSVYVNANGGRVQSSLNTQPNWNGDVDGLPGQPYENEVEANIDTSGRDGRPKSCTNDDLDELNGADDWSYVSLSFHSFGDSSNGAIRSEPEPVPTLEDLESMYREINTTDLAVSQSDSPDPVAAGTDLGYTITVRNQGLNPANSVRVVDTLPAGVAFKSSTADCAEATGVTTCHLGGIPAGGSRTFTITVGVPADLVYNNGGPEQLTNQVQVQNLLGPDPATGNNQSTETTQAIAVADVEITDATVKGPLEVLIGRPSTASLSVVAENDGPSSPIDTVLVTDASADQGVTVTPAESSATLPALTVGHRRTISFDAALACTSPGQKTITLASSLNLKNAEDTDPDLTNNSRKVSFTIDCVVPIAINVRPHGFPNSINLNTDATLAALTTVAGEYGLPLDFEATSIDVSKTLWGLKERLFNVATPTGATEIHGRGHPERSYELDERTRDADTDLVLHFKPSASGLTPSSTEACLKGKYAAPDGKTYTFLGCDSVRITN
ncbi:hypothetical protein OG607_03775 [Streptomyces sp. NBC_01537]|uniref:hypothetical protein n=1 Tax=Streptomyces sp. NBC_01537 TaxID=2903896 RepID=UPI00386A5DAC